MSEPDFKSLAARYGMALEAISKLDFWSAEKAKQAIKSAQRIANSAIGAAVPPLVKVPADAAEPIIRQLPEEPGPGESVWGGPR